MEEGKAVSIIVVFTTTENGINNGTLFSCPTIPSKFFLLAKYQSSTPTRCGFVFLSVIRRSIRKQQRERKRRLKGCRARRD